MIVDSHAHYSHRRFDNTFSYLTSTDGEYSVITDGHRTELLDKIFAEGTRYIIEPAIDLKSNGKVLELCRRYRGRIFPAVGVHPTRVHLEKWRDRKKLEEYAADPNVIAIGETGLDYHYPRREQHRLCQYMWFTWQLKLAHRYKKPLILHIRNADKHAIRILKRYRSILHGGVVHCFSGNSDAAHEYIRLGFHLGIGGALLQEGEKAETLREIVGNISAKHILIETDAPYVHPSCGGQITKRKLGRSANTSLILPEVIRCIAELKGISCELAANITARNAVNLFRLNDSDTEK